MGGFIFAIVWFLAYWAGMALVISLDGRRQRAKAKATGGVDFMDRSPMPYMLLGALCGPLPLIAYFGTTRKTAAGWVLGVAISLGWTVLFIVIFSVGMTIINRIH